MISAATRLQGIFFWDFFIYLIEGIVFLTTGLQARMLIDRIGHYAISELAVSAARRATSALRRCGPRWELFIAIIANTGPSRLVVGDPGRPGQFCRRCSSRRIPLSHSMPPQPETHESHITPVSEVLVPAKVKAL